MVEERGAGIDADLLTWSSSSLRDSSAHSLHIAIEASNIKWLSSPRPGSATASNL